MKFLISMLINEIYKIIETRKTIVRPYSRNKQGGRVYIPQEYVGKIIVWFTIDEIKELLKEIEELKRERDSYRHKLSLVADAVIERLIEMKQKKTLVRIDKNKIKPLLQDTESNI